MASAASVITLALSMATASAAAPPAKSVSACKEAGAWRLLSSGGGDAPCKGVVAAKGAFVEGLHVNGWGVLNVEATATADKSDQGYGAGLVEGFLTASHIHDLYLNVAAFTFGCTNQSCVPANVTNFMDAQWNWSMTTATAKKATDPFWASVDMVNQQFMGLAKGYSKAKDGAASGKALPLWAFMLLNGVGDLFQIIPSVDKTKRQDYTRMSKKEARAALLRQGHCSALIRVPGALEDLLMAHSSWFEYPNMDRIFKYYTLDGKTTSFSSYPGYLESLDDFYMMDSGLGMVQTSNNVLNHALYDLIVPTTLLAWQRVRVASQLAKTGEEWYQYFKTAASGTYVNQYMVVDFNLFSPGKALQPGTLWVIEEIPGLVKGGDQTPTLARGYWPSYNVPFYAEVYLKSGYAQVFDEKAHGKKAVANNLYDGGGAEYTIGAPRSKIFRRDHGKVVDMATYRDFMRYADYDDPYSKEPDGSVNYGAAICMRGDLESGGFGKAGGCYDSKVTSYNTGFRNLTAQVVNGPSSRASSTTSTIEPFAWRPFDGPHVGLPERYDFPWITVTPSMAKIA